LCGHLYRISLHSLPRRLQLRSGAMQRSHAPSLPPAFVPCRAPRAGRPRRLRAARCAAAGDEPGAWIAQHAGAGAVTQRSSLGGSDWASFARYDTGAAPHARAGLQAGSWLTRRAAAQRAAPHFS